MALSTPKLTVGKTSGPKPVFMKLEGTIDWPRVVAQLGRDCTLYVVIVEVDELVDDIGLDARNRLNWRKRGDRDDLVLAVPIQHVRPANNERETYGYTWHFTEKQAHDERRQNEFRAKLWLTAEDPGVLLRYESAWSNQVQVSI